MAMSSVTVQEISKLGISPSYEGANVDGNSFANDGKTFFVVKNADVAEKTVTIDSKVKCNQGFDHDLAVAVPAGEERWIGPFEPARFTGTVEATYSDITSVTVAALKT